MTQCTNTHKYGMCRAELFTEKEIATGVCSMCETDPSRGNHPSDGLIVYNPTTGEGFKAVTNPMNGHLVFQPIEPLRKEVK